MSDWLGKMLGKVRIDSLLARGGIAEVYLGEHVALQREVAVKILRNQYEDDPDLLERFQREARVVAKLRHSNIVQVFDFDSIESRPYLVMEYVPGVSLSRYLHVLHGKNGRLELPIISRIITQVAHALQYAHESGVIHRDVKPGNILLTSRTEKVMAGKPLPGDFEPILTDFGLVRFLNSSRQTTTGVIAGTPAYMSPEQARGEPTDERTDIYSLGIVLYELLTGHVPFDGETTMAIILKQVTEPPPPVPGVPFELQHVLNRALAKRPEDRYQTANDLAREFEACIKVLTSSDTVMNLDSGPTTHITTIGYKDVTKPGRKWRTPALLAGAVIVLLSGFFAFKGALLPVAPTATPSVTQSLAPTATITNTFTPTSTPVPIALGVLHFQDNAAILDQASFSALDIPAPPEGSHYEVWLTGAGVWRSIGILNVEGGKGELILQDDKGLNLLSAYDQVVITVELNSDTDKKQSDVVAYAAIYPAEGLSFLRQMLVFSKDTPKNIALIQGLSNNIGLIDQSARAMQSAYQKGNENGARQNVEAILNILAGDQSENRQDWNGDQKTNDPSDGFGSLPNGKKAGYIQAVATYADLTVKSNRATVHMSKHGAEVLICAQNLSDWAKQLQDLATIISTSPSGTDLSQPILDSVQLADQLLNGVDTNNDKSIDAVAGECGMSSLYGYAYSMADLSLLAYDPATFPATETPTAMPTSASDSGNGTTVPGSGTTTNPTQKPVGKPPTKESNPNKPPTKTPRK